MKVIYSFTKNNIEYSIVEINKNEKFIIPCSCIKIDGDNILISEDQFKILDPENYKRYLLVKEKLNYQDLLKLFEDKEEIPFIKEHKIVNLYIDEYIKNKKEWFMKRRFDEKDYFICIRKDNDKFDDKYDLTVRKKLEYDGRIYRKQGRSAHKLLDEVNKYDLYFDKIMLKYKINMINYIKLAFENKLIVNEISPNECFTDNDIIEIFERKINIIINEKIINRLVELIDSEIIFNYNFGDKSYFVKINKVNDEYQLDVHNFNIHHTPVLSKSGNNACQLLKEVLYNYESCDGDFMLKSEVNIKKYIESLFK
jgi:hypothetical protein